MRSSRLFAAAALAAGTIAATDAAAHVTLERPEAAADSYYKAVFRVGHGCAGSPTVRMRVRLPEGTTAVKPQPKPGWDVAIVTGPLATPMVDGHGKEITQRVVEIAWSGHLPDAHYDEFAIRMKLPDAVGSLLPFPVVQECETGVHRWIEVPKPGEDAGDYQEPAPTLRLTPKQP